MKSLLLLCAEIVNKNNVKYDETTVNPFCYKLLNTIKYSNCNLDTTLRDASARGDLETVKILVEIGANIHVKQNQPLRNASDRGDLEMVKFLIENGANIHARKDGAFRYACRKNHVEVAKYLLSQGACINAYDNEALREACDFNNFELVKFLLENGANITYKIMQSAFDRKLKMYFLLKEFKK